MSRPLRTDLLASLLATSASAFASAGFRAVSLDQVARGLGLTKGAVYFHFRSKMDLFLRSVAWLEEQRDRGVPAPPAEDPLAAIAALLAHRLAFGAQHPELRRLHWIVDNELGAEAVTAVRDGLRADYRRLRAELRALLQQAMRLGQVRPADAAAAAFDLAAVVEGALAQLEAAPEDVQPLWDPVAMAARALAPLARKVRRRAAAASRAPADREAEDRDFRPAF
jgi:AcrR family transcriptional regulator